MNSREAWLVQVGLLKRALAIIGPKRLSYSGVDRPFDNFYGSEAFTGVPAWRGAKVRLGDKFSRMDRIVENGIIEMAGESLLDAAADAINYTCIMISLMLEQYPSARPLVEQLLRDAEQPWPSDDQGK